MKRLLQIIELQQLADNQILQVIMIKCRPPLKDHIEESINFQHSVDQQHAPLIRHFIPTGIYEELKRKTVLRVQEAHDRPAHSISEIREFHCY